MGELRSHQSRKTTKMLLIGDSGAGKTGALASLAKAGYRLWIADFDNGLDVLANLLKDDQEALGRVHFKTLTDPHKQSAGKLIPIKATVWTRAIKLFSGEEKWEVANEPGSILEMTDQDVLVIDSLTFISKAALNYTLSLQMRLGQRPQLQDWGDGQASIEGLLAQLYDEAVKCNVIVISHITFIGSEDGGPLTGYPNTLGKALPPKVGQYFNSILQVKTSGSGANRKRKLLTQASSMVELKTSAPTNVKAEYDIANGLADYFRDVRA